MKQSKLRKASRTRLKFVGFLLLLHFLLSATLYFFAARSPRTVELETKIQDGKYFRAEVPIPVRFVGGIEYVFRFPVERWALSSASFLITPDDCVTRVTVNLVDVKNVKFPYCDFRAPVKVTLDDYLRPGPNAVAVWIENKGGGGGLDVRALPSRRLLGFLAVSWTIILAVVGLLLSAGGANLPNILARPTFDLADAYPRAALFLIFLWLPILFQIELFFSYYSNGQQVRPIDLLCGQHDNFLLAIAFSFLASMCRKRIWAKLSFLLLLVPYLIYLNLDQILYGLTFTHLRLSMFWDSGKLINFAPAASWQSLKAQTDRTTYLNVAMSLFVFVGVAAYLNFANSKVGVRRLDRKRRIPILPFAPVLVFLVALQFYYRSPDESSLTNGPLVILAQDILRSLDSQTAEVEDIPNFERLKFGANAQSDARTQTTSGTLSAMEVARHRLKPKPNVVYLLLESVGSRNILPEGRLDPKVTPNLAAFQNRSTVFPNVYNLHPSSTRSHVAIQTGGSVITSGSVLNDLAHRYLGSTLPGEFKKNGYRTGLFSAGDSNYENLLAFYRTLPFDRILDGSDPQLQFANANTPHNWGIDERVIVQKAGEWITRGKKSQPFYLALHTCVTHHPYGAPTDYKSNISGSDSKSNYRRGLQFTDKIIGDLVAAIKREGLLDDTVFFISGDHPEAFGDPHPTVFGHSGALYEENIRNFLLVVDFRTTGQFEVIPRIGGIGDVMPTILDFTGNVVPPDVQGASLVAPGFAEKIHFFHKQVSPAQWGLRDGNWKFISAQHGKNNDELYFVDGKDSEKTNFAEQRPEMVRYYRKLCAYWFRNQNTLFLGRLENQGSQKGRDVSSLGRIKWGPREMRLVAGPASLWDIAPTVRDFELGTDIVTRVDYAPYESDRALTFEWISPSKQIHSRTVPIGPNWSTSLTSPPERLVEQGEWVMRIRDESEILLTQTFRIVPARKNPVVWPAAFESIHDGRGE